MDSLGSFKFLREISWFPRKIFVSVMLCGHQAVIIISPTCAGRQMIKFILGTDHLTLQRGDR